MDWHATTILSVRRGGTVALGGDGQVTLGSTVMKADAVKIRRLLEGRVLVGLMPGEPEPRGLLALMLLHEARRATRTRDGVLVTLEHQDRSRWDRALIDEGVATLDAALPLARTGPYQVQAAIAACHAGAPDAASTDWPQIAAL